MSCRWFSRNARCMLPAGVFALLLPLGLAATGGCSAPVVVAPEAAPTTAVLQPNPTLIPTTDHQLLWQVLVDTVDDYFRIRREEPVRQFGNVLTEGRLETYPEVSATVLEPWRWDTVTAYDRWEATLQTMRRFAQVRVVPASGGFQVEVAVYKELEDARRPEFSSASDAVFPHTNSMQRLSELLPDQPIHQGWIPKGRDTALEQQILARLRSRLGG